MKTTQAEYRSDLAELMQQIADRNADLMQQIADRNAEVADRVATATERMASNRWWQMAVLIAFIALTANGIPALLAFLASQSS